MYNPYLLPYLKLLNISGNSLLGIWKLTMEALKCCYVNSPVEL